MSFLLYWTLLLLLLLATTNNNVIIIRVGGLTHPRDVKAMRDLKQSLDSNSVPPSSCLATWDFRFDPCDTHFTHRFVCGFECETPRNPNINITSLPASSSSSSTSSNPPLRRVTAINLDSCGYRGSLPASLSLLSALTALQLSGNSLSGPIPASLSLLRSLTLLDLSSNSFQGLIPASLGSLPNLRTLNLRENKLSGSIPTAFNNLVRLQECRLDDNNLTGSLPLLPRLSGLRFLDASNNFLRGAIPAGLPPTLASLSLRNNRLSGVIPFKAIARLNQLNVLDLSGNQLSGGIDPSLILHTSLQQINLSFNKLSVLISLPSLLNYKRNIANSQMVAVDLGNNLIAGPLPEYLPAMPRLCSLSLRRNLFTGRVPLQYGLKAVAIPTGRARGVVPFERLLLDGNYLVGPLPKPLLHLQSPAPAGNSNAQLSLVDNCLESCPLSFFFCQGGPQKTQSMCRLFNATP